MSSLLINAVNITYNILSKVKGGSTELTNHHSANHVWGGGVHWGYVD